MGVIAFFAMHFLIFIICIPSKKRMVSNFLVWSKNSTSFSFGFCLHFSKKKTVEVASLLPLLEEYIFRVERRDIRGCWIPPLLMSWPLMWFGELRFQRKSSSLLDKFCLVG